MHQKSKHPVHQVHSRLAGAPKKYASSASAGLLLVQLRQRREHYRHQLGWSLCSCTEKRTSLASAGLLLAQPRKKASIMGISRAASRTAAPEKPASSASAGLVLAQLPHRSEHHRHQLDCFLHSGPRKASIIGISWAASCTTAPEKRASSASTKRLFAQLPQRSEHHQQPHKEASIIGISWAASRTAAPEKRASWASAGLLPVQVPQKSQHHQHQLGCFLHSCRTEASVIGISWIASCKAARETSIIGIN